MSTEQQSPASSDRASSDPASHDTWDVIVIGGGPVGENAAQYAIAGSRRTAVLVESELVGGECSYWACMPSKALLLPGQVRGQAAAMPGVDVADRLDVSAVLSRRDGFTSHWDDDGQVGWARNAGIDVLRGHGEIVGVRQVRVGDRTLTAREAVIVATGSVPVLPNTPGLADAQPWTSRDATAVQQIPDSVAVIGGGVVACEAATWLASLGAHVTMLVRDDGLLASAEPFAGERVATALADAGVDVRTGTEATSVSRVDVDPDAPTGRVHGGRVTVDLGGDHLQVDELLVATGRRPAIDGIGLDSLALDGIEVDDHLQVQGVDGDWLYACGDVAGRAALTHMGKYQARVCGDVIAARADGRPLDRPSMTDRADHDAVTQVVFTDPEVAWVGRTEAAARDEFRVGTVELDIAVAGSALSRDDFAGHAKLVVDEDRNVLLGATFVGQGIAELLHAATIAVIGGVDLDTLWHAVPAYPTVSEVWLRLLEQRRSA